MAKELAGGLLLLQVMTAEPASRRKGMAVEALQLLMAYAASRLVRRFLPVYLPDASVA